MENEEVKEEIKEEEKKAPPAPESGFGNAGKIIVLAIAAVLAIFMIFRNGKAGNSEADGCNVNFQSAWGQTPTAVWIDLNSYNEAKAVAVFDFEYPSQPLAGYETEAFRAYSRQVFEVAYFDASGKEGIRFSKAYTCNAYEIYEPKDGEYRSIQIADIDGMDVKEYGDGETVSMLFFAKGDYSYTILMNDNPLSREEAESFVTKLN